MVELFDERVEISNPGGLVSAIPVAEFGKRSHSRNPLIFGLFARMHLVEKVGSGVARMKQLMVEASLPLPVFNTTGIFSVILQRPEKSSVKKIDIIKKNEGVNEGVFVNIEGVNEGTKKMLENILSFINENPMVKISDIESFINKSNATTERYLKILRENHLVEYVGANKTGGYKVVGSR